MTDDATHRRLSQSPAQPDADRHEGSGGEREQVPPTRALATIPAPRARSIMVYGAHGAGTAVRGLARGTGWLARKVLPIDQPLLKNQTFRAFWLSRLFVQTAQGIMLYALLIVIADLTNSAFYNALFVNCSILPGILFGIPGGIVSDSLPRRPLMVGINLLRFTFIAALIFVEPSLPGVFAVTLGIWVMHQFYSPAESSVVADLVTERQIPNAQALHNLALTLAQAMGLVILAPVLLRFFSMDVVYATCAALFFAAAGFSALLPRLDHPDPVSTGRLAGANRPRGLKQTILWLLSGWQAVRRDRIAFGAILDDMLVGVGLSTVLVIMPLYLEAVLGTAKENTTFVFAPAALGLVVGLRAAPTLGQIFENRWVATGGLVLFAATVLGFGFVDDLFDLLNDGLGLPLYEIGDFVGISPMVLLAMTLSIPAGFASAIVGVAGRSVLLSRTAPTMRGQVIATQNLFQNIVALIPTLITGIVADVFGVQFMAVAIGLVILIGAFFAHRKQEVDEPVFAPA